MGRYLGIDYGTRRVGIAISDVNAEFAFPRETVEVTRDAQAIARICVLAKEEDVAGIVVGLPRNMNGTHGPMALTVLAFVERLRKASGRTVETWDERMTTAAVERSLIAVDMRRDRRKEIRDKLAAQSLLQAYLDSKRPAPGVSDADWRDGDRE